MALVHNNLGCDMLNACSYESVRVHSAIRDLEGLRMSLPLHFHPHLTMVINGLYLTRRRLGDILDSSQVYMVRVPIILDYLNTILPCLVKTLQDIDRYCNDEGRTREMRWRAMYNDLTNELPGTTLPARFIMYNQFLELINLLLTKSPNFDMNALYSLNDRVCLLREARNIPPPSPIQRRALMWHESVEYWEDETDSHWAESIFTTLPPTRTTLEKPRNHISQAFGPFERLGQPVISPDAKILVKRSFNDDHLSVIFFLQRYDDAPYILVRADQDGQPWVSVLGAHNLCISRHDNATLNLQRWSKSENRSKVWAALKFILWEEMILFYCTFICLKARSTQTVDMGPSEHLIRFERKPLPPTTILDDGFHHSLSVCKDIYTDRYRLQASVHEGELKGCPVWTAFLPEWSGRSRPSWIKSISRHRVWIRDLQPYIFCEEYRAYNQRRGKRGDFELKFATEHAAIRFVEWFDHPSAQRS